MTGLISTPVSMPSSSSQRSLSGVSAWSTSITLLQWNWTTWRAISAPMEPAAPVMSMFWPSNWSRMASLSISMTLRPRRSSILILLSCCGCWGCCGGCCGFCCGFCWGFWLWGC